MISAVLAGLLYCTTLAGTYVYDDVAVVRDDPRVRHVDQWDHLFTRDYFNGGVDNLYRPIVSFSYALEWRFHGDRPWIFHLVNLLLNAAVCACVAEMTRRLVLIGIDKSIEHMEAAPGVHPGLRSAGTAGLIAGLFFAAHPIHVEAVANIVGRAELASALCVIWALIFLSPLPLRGERARVTLISDDIAAANFKKTRLGLPAEGSEPRFSIVRIVAALFIAILGLFCKEQSVLQPLLWLFGWYLLIRGRTNTTDPEKQAGRVLLLSTCWIWAIYLAAREHYLKFDWDRSFLDWSVQPMINSNGIDRILMPIVLVGHYAQLIAWPAHLSPDYGGDVIGSVVRMADPYLWIGLIAIIAWLVAVTFSIRRKDSTIAFCLLSFAAIYGMTGNIISIIGTNLAERLMYLPTAFLAAAAGIVVARLTVRARWIILTPLLLVMSYQTVGYARLWNRPADLFATALQTHPGSVQLYLLLSQSDRDAGRFADAEAVLAQACGRHPTYYRVWVLRAENAMDMHDWPAAHHWLDVAMKTDSNHQQIAAAMDELQKREPATRPTTRSASSNTIDHR